MYTPSWKSSWSSRVRAFLVVVLLQSACQSKQVSGPAAPAPPAPLAVPPVTPSSFRSHQVRFAHPQPQGNDLHGIFGASENVFWAVGTFGTVVHFQEGVWSAHTGLTSATLRAGWASDAQHAWAVGDRGTLLYWNGTIWKPAPSFTANDLYAVWSFTPQDVWVAGSRGSLFHFDGKQWKAHPTASREEWRGLWGLTSKNLWAVSKQGTIGHWDGVMWHFSSVRGEMHTIGGTSSQDIWVAGPQNAYVYDGQQWQSGPPAIRGTASSGTSMQSWLLNPKEDKIFLYRNQHWRLWQQPQFEMRAQAVWSPSKQTAWAAGEHGVLYHFDGTEWRRVPPLANVLRNRDHFFYALWGTGPTNVWALGETLFHFNGKQWIRQRLAPTWNGITWHGMWGLPDGRAWLVGSRGNIAYGRKEDWYEVSSGVTEELTAVWGTDATNIWAVGEQGTVLHSQGHRFFTVTSGTQVRLQGIWGSGVKDVWVVGDHGVVLHYDGALFKPTLLDSHHNLRTVWGTSATNVWIGGEGGTLQHFDGTLWEPASLVLDKHITINALWGSSAKDVWALGTGNLYEGGLLFHFDGNGWQEIPSGVQRWLLAVWGASAHEVWAAGADGTIVRITPYRSPAS